MQNFSIKRFFEEAKTQDPQVRMRYGMIAGVLGMAANLFLFAGKLTAGWLSNSISVMADAFNNLSDMGSSLVTLIGFKMAGKPADRTHPFGHGRIEYLSGLVVSFAIMMVGIELMKNSFSKILHPEIVEFRLLTAIILLGSVSVKLLLCLFNRTLASRLQSSAMQATAMDSFTDSIATTAVLIGMLIGHFFHLQIDGWIGVLVAGFIFYTGIITAKDSVSPLLGKAPDKEFVQEIEQTVLSHPEVVGIHDLIIHDYGPGQCIISLHAEMPCEAHVLIMHDVIDIIELELQKKFSCEATIHMDPIAPQDEETMKMDDTISTIVHDIDSALSIHDFRMVRGKTHTNLVFDVLVPHRFRLSDEQVSEEIRNRITEMNDTYFAVIRIDKSYV